MKVNFVAVLRQTQNLKKDLMPKIEAVLDKSDFIQGQAIAEFEEAFAKFCNKKYCVALNSGTDALEFSLLAYGITEGEVITAPNSYFSTAMVITKVGAKPVFVDVDEESFNLDVEKLEAAITDKTKAIIPVHLAGQPADMDPILELAKKHNLIVIEDACQAHGAEYKGKKTPIGETGCFSFFPGKNLGSFGDSGAIVTDNEEVMKQAHMLRNDGCKEKYQHHVIGFKSRMDTVQAVILTEKLKHLANWIEQRRECAKKYDALLQGVITLPKEMSYAKHAYHLYVVRTEKRDELQNYLAEKGIATVIHYPIPIHKQKAYEERNTESYPITEKLSKTILSIPIFPEITEEEIKCVVENIKAFMEKN